MSDPLEDIPFGEYPCCVIQVCDLLKLQGKLIKHEEALELGYLWEAVPNLKHEDIQGRGHGYMNVYRVGAGADGLPVRNGGARQWDASMIVGISHRWIRGGCPEPHPDDEEGTKLKALQKFSESLRSDQFIWMDYLGMPQNNKENMGKAIRSLKSYFMYFRTFVSLVLDEDDYDIYSGRGWCRFEQIMSFIPIFFREGMQMGNSDGSNVVLHAKTMTTVPIKFEDLQSPSTAAFSYRSDLQHVLPLVKFCLSRFERFNEVPPEGRYVSKADYPASVLEEMRQWVRDMEAEVN